MPDSEKNIVTLWKERAEIDYMSLFMPLWLSLDAWMRDRYTEDTDRKRLELFKQGGHEIFEEYFALLFDDDDRAKAFRGNLAELHRALEDAKIHYNKDMRKFISFSYIRVTKARYINLLEKTETEEENKIELAEDIFIINDESMVFSGFIEILYQIRCVLFHGDLKPDEANKRVIKQLYLIMLEVMKRV
ncbi:hypothetical protein ACFL3G_04615 [Planctomycetota bacterium]